MRKKLLKEGNHTVGLDHLNRLSLKYVDLVFCRVQTKQKMLGADGSGGGSPPSGLGVHRYTRGPAV